MSKQKTAILVLLLSLGTSVAFASPKSPDLKKAIDCYYALAIGSGVMNGEGLESLMPSQTLLATGYARDPGMVLVPKKNPGQYFVFYQDKAFEITFPALHNCKGNSLNTQFELVTADKKFIPIALDHKNRLLAGYSCQFLTAPAISLSHQVGEAQSFPALNDRIKEYLGKFLDFETKKWAALNSPIPRQVRQALETCSQVHLTPGFDVGAEAAALLKQLPAEAGKESSLVVPRDEDSSGAAI